MKKNSGYGPVIRESNSFIDEKGRNTNRKPALLFILPILMILVLLITGYLAYKESQKDLPQPRTSATEQVSSVPEKGTSN